MSALETGPSPDVLGVSEFKKHCLAVVDDVARTGMTVTITKHGRPVARLVPIEDRTKEIEAFLRGFFVENVTSEEELFSTGEEWQGDPFLGR
jgi:prevent-host-death family protein